MSKGLQRSAALVAGVFLGFLLLGWFADATTPAVQLSIAPSPMSAPAGTAEDAPASAPESANGKDVSLPVAAGGAAVPRDFSPREHPYAYNLAGYLNFYVSADNVEELRRHPEFLPLYRNYVGQQFEERFWAVAPLLGLSRDQAAALQEIAIDQVVELRLQGPEIDKAEREEATQQANRKAIERIDALLSPERRDDFPLVTQLGPEFLHSSAIAAFQAAGEPPLTMEQIKASIVVREREGNRLGMAPYRYATYVPNPDLPNLTPGQRDMLQRQRRIADLQTLMQAVEFAKVRDPELSDIWPF